MKDHTDKIALAAALAITATVYGANLHHSFQYDDAWKIVDNPQLRAPASYLRALSSGTGYREAATRLLPNLTFALNHHRGDLDPVGYHLTNLVFHLFNVVLVWAFARTLLHRLAMPPARLPELAALLFALHPLSSEAVSYCNARPNLMVTSFYLSALLCLLGATGQHRARTRGVYWAGFAVATGCALLSKELAITLVLMAPLLCEWLGPHNARLHEALPGIRKLTAALWLLGAVSLIATGALAGVTRVVLVAGPTHTGSVTSYLLWTWLGQAPVLLHYLALAVWPAPSLLNACRSNQHLHMRALADGQWVADAESLLAVPIASCAMLALLGLLVFRHRHRQPLASLCGVWMFVTHAPHTLLPRGEVMVEYRTYLPMVGTCILLALGLKHAASWLVEHAPEKRAARRATTAGLVALVVTMAWTTRVRLRAWTDQEAFWRDVLVKEPESPRGHNGQGDLARRRGDLQAAAEHYRRAIASDPQYTTAVSNLGALFATSGRPDEARPLLEEALLMDPRAAFPRSNLANVLVELGELDAAIEHYQTALQHHPRFIEAHMNLARAQLLKGDADRAIERYKHALTIDDHFAPGYRALGRAQLSNGRPRAAQKSLQRATALAPEDPEAHYQLARALAYLGDEGRAIEHLRITLSLRPRHRAAAGMLAALSR